MSICTSTTSRVVPATGLTIAAGRAASRLSSELLPALGGPTMATLTPDLTISPLPPSRRCLSISAARPLTLGIIAANAASPPTSSCARVRVVVFWLVRVRVRVCTRYFAGVRDDHTQTNLAD